jgi:hypothetical protein
MLSLSTASPACPGAPRTAPPPPAFRTPRGLDWGDCGYASSTPPPTVILGVDARSGGRMGVGGDRGDCPMRFSANHLRRPFSPDFSPSVNAPRGVNPAPPNAPAPASGVDCASCAVARASLDEFCVLATRGVEGLDATVCGNCCALRGEPSVEGVRG